MVFLILGGNGYAELVIRVFLSSTQANKSYRELLNLKGISMKNNCVTKVTSISSLVLGAILLSSNAFAATTLKFESCTVKFQTYASTLENKSAVSDCQNDFKYLKPHHFQVIGRGEELLATGRRSNIALERATAIKSELNRMYPGISVAAETPEDSSVSGNSAEIRIFYEAMAPAASLNSPSVRSKKTESTDNAGDVTDANGTKVASIESDNQKAPLSTMQRENLPSGWNDMRLAVRGGNDKLWRKGERYQAVGIDTSYVRRNVGTRLVRMEAGATGSFLLKDAQDMVGFNYHGTFFPSMEVSALVVGPRFLLGASWDKARGVTELDAGGEGRVGLESGNFSLFLSGGRTRELTRLALDVGATF